MLDRLADYRDCLAEPDRWVIATVCAVSGSVPRPIGTSMAVRDDATTIGSISAGCVESAIIDAALTMLAEHRTATLESFGYGDDDGLAVGLMCGGDLQVLIQPLGDLAPALRVLFADQTSSHAVVRPLSGESLGQPVLLDYEAASAGELDRLLGPGTGDFLPQLLGGGTQHLAISVRDGASCTVRRLLVESPRSRPRMLIYGANDYAAALARAANLLDRYVIVCDARPVFATARRHPGADEVVVEHPADHLLPQLAGGLVGPRDAVIVLTHDPRYDLPVLDLALRAGIGYVGAMGSRQTCERRAQELLHGGLPAELLARLHAPIGLNLGARTPQEVAVAILAELIGAANGRDDDEPVPLRHTVGPVHEARPVERPVAPRAVR